MDISSSDHEVLVVTSNGYGKKTDVEQYRMTHRGSKGVKALNMTDKTGTIVAFKSVVGDEDLIIVTDAGIIIRLSLSQVSNTGRVAQGVKLINLKDEQHVSTVTVLDKVEESEDTVPEGTEVTENVESNDSISNDTN
jgi:DNA gyrase subunit A